MVRPARTRATPSWAPRRAAFRYPDPATAKRLAARSYRARIALTSSWAAFRPSWVSVSLARIRPR